MQWSMHSAYWGQLRKDVGTGNFSDSAEAHQNVNQDFFVPIKF